MTNYYIEKDNKIIFVDTDLQRLQNTVALGEYSSLEIKETDRPIVNFQFADTPEYIAEQAQKEQERVGNLTMTALDFIKMLTEVGLTYEQIKAYLDSNAELDMQLKYCQNVYCGVVLQICPLTIGDFTLTEEMVIQAFELKNGEV